MKARALLGVLALLLIVLSLLLGFVVSRPALSVSPRVDKLRELARGRDYQKRDELKISPKTKLSEPPSSEQLDALFSPIRERKPSGTLAVEEYQMLVLSSIFESLLASMHPDTEWTAAEWENLAQTVWSTAPEWRHLSLALAAEMNSRLAVSGPGSISEFLPPESKKLLNLPGLLKREARIYANDMSRMIQAVEDRDFTLPERSPLELAGLLSGKQGFFSKILLPNYRSALAQSDLTRAQLMGLSLSAALCAYRKKYGAFPEQLSDLASLGLSLASHDERQEFGLGYTSSGSGVVVSVKPPEKSQPFIKWSQFEAKNGWVRHEGGRLNFYL